MGLQDSIKQLVRCDVPQVQASDTVKKVIQNMMDSKVTGVLVYQRKEIVGVVSATDLIQVVLEDHLAGDSRIESVMTPCKIAGDTLTRNPCAQIDEEESVNTALRVFEASGTHSLVVSSEGCQSRGMVCLRDTLWLAMQ